MTSKLKREYQVRSAECDRFNQMRIRSLFNLFQDVADLHAESLGVGYTFCLENNLTWMGSGYHVEINRLPKRDEKIELYTWPSDAMPLMAVREFELKTNTGEVLVKATSGWILIDLNKRRPLPLQKYIAHLKVIKERSVNNIDGLKKVVLPDDLDLCTFQIVREDDIDINQHVNNSVYPSWILDTVSEDFLSSHTLNEVTVQFKQGVQKENKVAIFTKIEDNNTYSLITDADKTSEFVKIVALWQKK